MKQTVRLAALRPDFEKMDEFSNPYSPAFDRAAAAPFMEKALQRTFALLHKAGEAGADLVLTSIDIKNASFYSNPYPDIFQAAAEPMPGPTSERLGEIARKYSMIVAASYEERAGDDIYSSVVILGRKGELIGVYRKVHLPVHEQWNKKVGTEIPVFKSEIGNLGVAICHDIAFTEQCRTLSMKGADIILYPTDGWGTTHATTNYNMGEALARIRAAENFCYLVAAKTIQYGGPGGKSCIVSPRGEIIAENAERVDGIVWADCGTDYDIVEPKHHFAFTSGSASVRGRYTFERVPAAYGELVAEKPAVMERYKDVHYNVEKVDIEQKRADLVDFQRAAREGRPHFLKDYHW